MPKIRDLGISVIPVTKRNAIGAAEGAYRAGGDYEPPDCIPTDGQCLHTDGDCLPTDLGQCLPSDAPACQITDCHATPDDQCCPTDLPGSTKDRNYIALPADAVVQLRQQLHQQIGAEFPS
jgi:hypothetical protein